MAMLSTLKHIVKSSPAWPIASAVYRKFHKRGDKGDFYDQETVEVMRRVLKPGSCCIDVGAHYGEILRHMIRFAPKGRHHAVEALPTLAAHLRAKFPSGVTVHEVAASTSSGTAQFFFAKDAPGFSGLRERDFQGRHSKVERITVTVDRIDAIVRDPITFIKVDVEGAEIDALRGAETILRRDRPVIVFEAGKGSTEKFGDSPQSIWQFFSSLGYTLSTMRRWLDAAAPYTREEFVRNWDTYGRDFYFIAYHATAP